MTPSQTTGPTAGSTSTPGVIPPPLRVSTPPGSNPNPDPNPPPGPPADDPVGDGPPTGTRSPGKPVNLPASASSLPRILVLAATLWLHDRLTRADDQDESDAWIATPDEAAQIADPLTSIATRHLVPQSLTGDLSPDTADLITAGIGLAGYVGRNIWDAITRFLHRRKHTVAEPGADDHPMGATA